MQSHSAAKTEPARETLSLSEVLHQSLAIAVVAADSQRCITTFNRAAENLTGSEAARARGQPIDFLPPPLRGAMQETFANGQAITDRELALHRDDGAQILIQASTTADCDADGNVRCVVLVFHD